MQAPCIARREGRIDAEPLAIITGIAVAYLWSLQWGIALGTVLFGVAILVAWQVQGFEPSPRDLIWFVAVVSTAWFSSWLSRRRRTS